MMEAEGIAKELYTTHGRLLPRYQYRVSNEGVLPWPEIPASDRATMIATIQDLIARGIIRPGGD